MDVQGRLIAAVLGALWGVLAGVLLVLFFSDATRHPFHWGLLIIDWKTTILGCSAAFGLMGLLFGVSIGTLLGRTIHGLFNLVIRNDSRGLLANESLALRLLVIASFLLAVYLYVA